MQTKQSNDQDHPPHPVLLLHGALGAMTQLRPIKSSLENDGRIVHVMNFSGHNGEPYQGTDFGIETFALDVLRFLGRQQILKVDIFGYSMGGYVALWLAHLHPERVNTIVTLGTKFDWSVGSAEREVRKLDPEKIEQKVPAFARLLESRHKPNDWKELLARTSSMMLQLGRHPLLTEEIIRSIHIPTLVCLGDNDDMADRDYSEHVAELLPGGKFLLLEKTAHPIESVNFVPFKNPLSTPHLL